MYLIVDESSHGLDLQHVGLMGSELVNQTVRCSVVPTDTSKQISLDLSPNFNCLSLLRKLTKHHTSISVSLNRRKYDD